MTLALADDSTAAAPVRRFRATRLAGLDDAFIDLAGRWAVSPFHTPGFLRAAAPLAAADHTEILLIAVRDEAGTPLALFPFTLAHRGRLRVIEGFGLGIADYYVPLTAPGFNPDEDEVRHLWRAVRSALPPADLLRLINVGRHSFGAAHALSNASFLAPMGHSSSTVVARNEAGDTVYDIKSLPLNRPLRKWVRRLERDCGPMRFAAAADRAETEELLAAMIRYRVDRFASLDRPDMLADPAAAAFYRALALPERGEPLARVYGLRAGGEIIGVIYGLPHGDTFTSLISSMSSDERYQRVSPGIMAMYFAIEDCLSRGNRAYDLTVGELSYKARFDGAHMELFEAWQALSPFGLLPALVGRARTRARLWRRNHPELAARLRLQTKRRAPAPEPAD